MEIKRDAYLQQLIERKDNGMIKVITGIRRCGKSFLLFTIFKRYLLENGVDVDHIIEIALDGIENEELRDPKVCFKYIKDAMKDDGKYYLLLDEVQFMPRFEEVLNSLLRMSNIDVYVTGSNSKFLSSDIVTEFRGRGDEIRIYPLSFAEFYSVYDGDYDDAWDDYMIYAFLEDYTGDRVCSKQLYAEALGNTNIPAEWETRAICEIMNTGISRGDIQGWQAHKTAKRYPKYGVQKGWERVTSPETGAENFSEITDAEAKQLGFPF